jgi:ABC-type transporter MlaC component
VPRGTNEVIVFSQILPGPTGGSPIAVNWRLRRSDDGYKVADVQVAGAWMSIEQQDQFTSIITNNNRETTKLIDFLRQQLTASAPRNANAS